MSTFTVVAFGLCLALASARVPSASPIELAQKVLGGEASPDALCKPICGSSCQVLKMQCTDIKGVVDCAAEVAKCASRCNQLCGCLQECPEVCAKDCSDNGNLMQSFLCLGRVSTCTNLCHSKCPIGLFTQEVMVSIKKMAGALRGLLGGADKTQNAAA